MSVASAIASPRGDAEYQHGRPPPEMRDPERDARRPERAGDVLAARDQRYGGAATTVEPAADVDDQGDIDRASAEQPDEQAVSHEELP